MTSKLTIKWFAFGILLIVVENFNIFDFTSGEILGFWATFGVLEVINKIEKMESESLCTKNYVNNNMEMYASECCGAVFVPGHGKDNIYEKEHSEVASYRDGECPVCGTSKPDMDLVFMRK